MRSALLASLTLLVLVLAAAGCKQGEGERCQINDDCESGLICSQAEKICVDQAAQPTFDAALPSVADAAGPDGALTPDAAPAPDGAVADAIVPSPDAPIADAATPAADAATFDAP